MLLNNKKTYTFSFFLVTSFIIILVLNADYYQPNFISTIIKATLILICLFYYKTFNADADADADAAFLNLKYFLWFQSILIIYSYFEPTIPRIIGQLIGFHLSPNLEFLFSREAFDPMKRAFSIFDNPNIASRILIFNLILVLSIRRLDILSIILVFVALAMTGSRTGIFIFVLLASFCYIKVNIKSLAMVLSFFVFLSIVYFNMELFSESRAFNISGDDNSLQVKISIFNEVLKSREIKDIYDSDLSLILGYFGLQGLIIFLVSIFVYAFFNFNSLINFYLLYLFSGTLLFSTVNVIFILFFALILNFREISLIKRKPV